MIIAEQVRAARALLGWSQGELAEKASVSMTTVRRMEDSAIGTGRSSADNLSAVQRALEAAGVVFQGDGELKTGGVGVRLKGL